uniref:Zgc:162608 n=1 Tax=Hippocampus comes TaxID=109280 RepID=A0A3Q3DTM9_HIPCM
MHLILLFHTSSICSLSPTHLQTQPKATWADSKANQAHPKLKITKEAEELLRARLRQELAELREKLAPSPVHLASTLASMRERLVPLTQQLHNNTHHLCHQVRLYLHGLNAAETNPDPIAHHWMAQTLEQSASKLADIMADFMAKIRELTERLREMSEAEAANAGIWQGFSSRLEWEVTSLKMKAQNSLEALKVDLADQSPTAQPLEAAVERFCQDSAQQHQAFQGRIERLIVSMEEELDVQFSSSHAEQPVGSLQDFSIKLSALIQDILHSVQ